MSFSPSAEAIADHTIAEFVIRWYYYMSFHLGCNFRFVKPGRECCQKNETIFVRKTGKEENVVCCDVSVMSCFVLCYIVLCCDGSRWVALSCLALSRLAFPCLALRCFVLSRVVLFCLVFCLAMSGLVLFCPSTVLPCLASYLLALVGFRLWLGFG